VRNAIIDEHCDIPDGMQIGVDIARDRERFDVTPKGIVLVTPGALHAAATIVHPTAQG
jgi:glucose-1-phosphate adenylyltransferase